MNIILNQPNKDANNNPFDKPKQEIIITSNTGFRLTFINKKTGEIDAQEWISFDNSIETDSHFIYLNADL